MPGAPAAEDGHATEHLGTEAEPVKLPHPLETRWTFFNTLSGRRQEEDPGGAPYLDERGKRHWLSAAGEWQDDPGPGPVNIDYRFVWVELWSADQRRVYYFNQETQSSSWDRPVDLAWIRLPADVAIGDAAGGGGGGLGGAGSAASSVQPSGSSVEVGRASSEEGTSGSGGDHAEADAAAAATQATPQSGGTDGGSGAASSDSSSGGSSDENDGGRSSANEGGGSGRGGGTGAGGTEAEAEHAAAQ
ncbi:hypothetical protein CHLNCDRAFT_141524 [Chlorella variabilis]|uniref:WW domain-containing protein n=1 Tax=Chlorella variabilis TaxID=554065 RepID=E1ZT18_CHLVA|nr:hypothetical protein CHLNCDRAFT_141524 [Chlorella variabilis]EFN51001.1 hypothetical protein CHLNCDRAFT_141524 [Chlorella variabilis]|eukprot:XP_005843103.1 hypothetical protein CHLNCDRAFT_141524 [Chlorella variabilis]